MVDDESTDKTREIAESSGAKVFVCKMDIEGKHIIEDIERYRTKAEKR